MGTSIDTKPRVSRCDEDVPMITLREIVVQIDFWVISVAKEQKLLLLFASEPLKGIL
jgi:hypothetical protein